MRLGRWVLCAFALLGCQWREAQPDAARYVPPDASPPSDAPVVPDAPPPPDAPVLPDAIAPLDAPAASLDALVSPIDAAPSFDALGNACTAAGGSCVALGPTSCAEPNTVGDANQYSCGGGLGVECCLPGTPVCGMTGTPQEGWYAPDGTLLCTITCSGQTAKCQRIGTSSQGWYTASGHGCPPHSTEIVLDSMCQ